MVATATAAMAMAARWARPAINLLNIGWISCQ
jgi:hypothetical protein